VAATIVVRAAKAVAIAVPAVRVTAATVAAIPTTCRPSSRKTDRLGSRDLNEKKKGPQRCGPFFRAVYDPVRG
jgi:hypothetical protein